jgi:hypothetical chaperone protein
MRAAGFDFGTSNSAIGIVTGNKAELAPLDDGATMIPTAVFFDFAADDKPLFGPAAINAYVTGSEGRLMRGLKTILSTNLINERTALSRRSIALTDVITIFSRHMRQKAEEAAQAPIDAVVHGRPVRFVEGDDAADRHAEDTLRSLAVKAGFADVSFLYEPVAAATQYEQTATREELVLVADIGGGTSDFSIVRIGPERRARSDRRSDILANTGIRVGGSDLDRHLSMQSVMPLLGLGTQLVTRNLPMPRSIYADLAWWPTINLCYTPKVMRELQDSHRQAAEPHKTSRLIAVLQKQLGHRMAFAVEAGKISLSSKASAHIPLDFIEPDLAAGATRHDFGRAIGAEIMRMRLSLRNCLSLADIDASRINTVFLTGGSSRVPAIETLAQEEFPDANLRRGDDFLSVAIGLTNEAIKRYR